MPYNLIWLSTTLFNFLCTSQSNWINNEALDEGNFTCAIFVDLEKTFDIVDQNILLKKLDHYGIRGISNKWFGSYLTDRKQFV